MSFPFAGFVTVTLKKKLSVKKLFLDMRYEESNFDPEGLCQVKLFNLQLILSYVLHFKPLVHITKGSTLTHRMILPILKAM